MSKRLISYLLAFCLLANLLVGFAVLAEEKLTTGTVVGIDANSKLYVRETPSTGAKVLDKLVNGNKVIIHDTVEAGGIVWYKVTTHNNIVGYASSAFIEIDTTYETDEEFEAYLTAQGFPEDYKVSLRKIHAQYPNWIFRADHLSMTWATALTAESKVGLNTITSPDSWKSMEYGAYNWNTNAYVVYDSGGWVTAAPALVAYYMDPRNWLDSTYIFQFEDLTYSDQHTVAGIQAILPTELDKHAEDLLKASKESGVNAYHLASRIAQEGSQNNGLGTGTVPGYEGYYNFFHIGAYAEYDKNGTLIISAVQRGARTAKENGWNTPYKALLGGAKTIEKGYVKLGQDTPYYQKFNFTNTTSGLYAHQYMSNVAAPSSEGRNRRNKASVESLEAPLEFNIPVFKSMPKAVAPMPSKEGNNNNFLDSLTVEGQELSPSFARYTLAYSLHVDETVDAINISAVLNNKDAAIAGNGKVALKHGENVIPITITATSGETRTYTLTVTREGTPPEGDEQPTPTPPPAITGTTYSVTDIVTKVEPETTVADFVKNLAVTNGTAAIYTASGQAKTSGVVGTGDILRLYQNDTLNKSYPILIYGDVNGDGKVTSLDLRIAQKHILQIDTIEGYYLTAADSSKDGSLTSLDLRVTQKYILQMTDSLQ